MDDEVRVLPPSLKGFKIEENHEEMIEQVLILEWNKTKPNL